MGSHTGISDCFLQSKINQNIYILTYLFSFIYTVYLTDGVC